MRKLEKADPTNPWQRMGEYLHVRVVEGLREGLSVGTAEGLGSAVGEPGRYVGWGTGAPVGTLEGRTVGVLGEGATVG